MSRILNLIEDFSKIHLLRLDDWIRFTVISFHGRSKNKELLLSLVR